MKKRLMQVWFRSIRASALGLLLLAGGVVCRSQSAPAVAASARIHTVVENNRTTRLRDHVPEWATAANDLGALPSGRRLDNLHLILARAPRVQAAFEHLLADQQDPASPRYHQWLTPQQNAEQFGIAPADLATVTAWLQSQGLTVDDVAAGGVFITFSGSVPSVETAFSTSLHAFRHEGATRYAPSSEPAIPAAIVAVVQSVSGLAELYAKPHLVLPATRTTRGSLYPEGGGAAVATPGYTLIGSTSGTVYHFLSPGDFSLIYDVNPVLNAGITGAGSRVVILGGSRVQPADVAAYETLYSLPSQQPAVVVLPTGVDPGYTGDGNEGEAILDVDRVLATAPGAGPDLLVAKNALAFTTTFSLLQYNISTLNDPIQSLSFGACEYTASSKTYAQQFDSYFATAAAQGIGTFISSGDEGAAGCDASSSTVPASQVLAPNLLCASSFATCVGGTEFADFATPSAYWSSTNSSTKVSALGYIPEGAWNEPTTTNSAGTIVYQAAGSGGGVSITVPKPAYQTGLGVPADGFRDTPDMSFASSTHNAYVLCFAAGGATCAVGGYVYPVGGTSAAAPSMAGIAALLNQKLGKRQGNLNPLFYRLADTPSNNVFHDITPASSAVSSCSLSTPSLCNNSTPSPTSITGGLAGYPLTAGFDLATGLGTLDVANFLLAANIGTTPSTLAVTATPRPTTVGASTRLTAGITATGSATPGGTVQFYSNGTAIGAPAILSAKTASITYFFPASGTFAITATYSGDPTFAVSTAPALSLEVDAAPFTVTASLSALTLTSAANVTSTVGLAVASPSTFAGPVALSCTVVPVSGTAAASCSVVPRAVTLDAGTTDRTAVLTIAPTPGTSGILNVVVTGVSATDYTTTPVEVTVTAPGFNLAATPSVISLLAGATATSSLAITSANRFTGTVGLMCALKTTSGSAAGTCAISPGTVALDSGASAAASVSVATSIAGSGVLAVTISGSGTTTGASLPATASTTVTLTVDTPRFTMSASPSALGGITAGATTGNASTITIASVNGLAGTVALSCTAALTTGGAVSNAPGCSVNPGSVTLISGGTQTAVVTISTAAGTSSCLTAELRNGWRLPGGLAFAGLLVAWFPLRRGRELRGRLLWFVAVAGALFLGGCGSGTATQSTCTNLVSGKTTSGAYTVTTTGVSGSLTSSATFTVTIN